MKCKTREEVKNKLNSIKYLKIRMNLAINNNDKEQEKYCYKEIKKIVKVIDSVGAKMGATYGTILALFYVNGLSLNEIADILKLNYDYIKHQKVAAIKFIFDNKML